MSQFGSRFTCPVGRHMPSCRALTAYHSSKLSNLSPSKSTPRKGEATLAQSAPGAFTEGIRRLSLRHAVGHAVRHAVWHSATICNQCYTLTPYVLHRFAVYQYNVVLGSMQQTIFTSCNLQNKKSNGITAVGWRSAVEWLPKDAEFGMQSLHENGVVSCPFSNPSAEMGTEAWKCSHHDTCAQ